MVTSWVLGEDTIDWGIFTLKIISVKIFVVLNVHSLVNPQKNFNGRRLQYGQAPGIEQSPLPGIKRARYRWL